MDLRPSFLSLFKVLFFQTGAGVLITGKLRLVLDSDGMKVSVERLLCFGGVAGISENCLFRSGFFLNNLSESVRVAVLCSSISRAFFLFSS